ncbi:two-component response regulator ORR26-like isoform X1 [Lycium ferocissimum]|uniref:two-component response regulator ORR26-like isoform X1 n=1 Tax=Lycium ferocissimum TaxID=112874 RepID=UPI0028162C5B|nr:two-component response regulator ORR26-like isoform X1 [Lycium ferocissimum]XP_059311447.1 two-component response regulator ORR26-like isoform X1 [Lycium ferocissimum]
MDVESSKNIVVPSSVRGHQIFVVDPNTTSLMHTAAILEEHYYKVTTIELPTIALSMILERESQYDLVIAEVNMQEMDGFTFLKHILRQKNIPIILISDKANVEISKRALDEGACFFWRKPLRVNDLINVWQHIICNKVKENAQKVNKGAVGGPKKGRVDELGLQYSSPMLSDASILKNTDKTEMMRSQIAELVQKCETYDANFAKIEKFMKKHMAQISDDDKSTKSYKD